jgi:hypothetical protein
MLKSTIKSSTCQDLFREKNNSIETAEHSYYRRADISLSVRTHIALDLLSREGEYGVVTPIRVNLRPFRAPLLPPP